MWTIIFLLFFQEQQTEIVYTEFHDVWIKHYDIEYNIVDSIHIEVLIEEIYLVENAKQRLLQFKELEQIIRMSKELE